ncbi:hypothetical protein HD806DRAFT_399750 [Xylariaceae sp. AK1471]|nr:hypothetical protein HD806DRAFT_399750 [Xylariaceae sp. AK1471]
MVRFSATATILAFAMTAAAIPSPLTPDPSGASHVGNGQGQQFIGGSCLSSKDCNPVMACCASFFDAKTSTVAGICSGLGAQTQQGKTGCGFGDGANGAPAPPASSTVPDVPTGTSPAGNTGTVTLLPGEAGAENVGTGNNQQFITGQCISDADCKDPATACCATGGKCAARAPVNDPSDPRECGFVGILVNNASSA